ncbi:MAG: hypothetical protein MI742_15415 [Desulfobacterales bacterium]|nr:hypothetical protein [Desulfobacterales bacterium]
MGKADEHGDLWKRMSFKGNKVWAEVDESENFKLEGGRVRIKYNLKQSHEYRVYPDSLKSDAPENLIPKGSRPKKEKKKSLPHHPTRHNRLPMEFASSPLKASPPQSPELSIFSPTGPAPATPVPRALASFFATASMSVKYRALSAKGPTTSPSSPPFAWPLKR